MPITVEQMLTLGYDYSIVESYTKGICILYGKLGGCTLDNVICSGCEQDTSSNFNGTKFIHRVFHDPNNVGMKPVMALIAAIKLHS